MPAQLLNIFLLKKLMILEIVTCELSDKVGQPLPIIKILLNDKVLASSHDTTKYTITMEDVGTDLGNSS